MDQQRRLSSRWAELFKLIPGYDPLKDSAGYVFDEELANRAIQFFAVGLVHTKGEWAGQPVKLEPWQVAIVGCLFGWVDKDGLRRYRDAFIYVPRKNGKSLLASGLALYVFYCDGEPGAEIYCAAAEREQAALVFNVAKTMVLQNEDLKSVTDVFQKAIVLKKNQSSFKAISADANTKHGFNAHYVVVDELHAQKNRELVDVLKTSMGSRRQPLMTFITTADYNRESICNETYDYACKVRDGLISDPSFLPVIHEAVTTDDWKSEEVWQKANPNLDVSVSRDFLRRECKKAQEVPAYEGTFKRLYLNIRTEQEVRWIPMDPFDKCGDPDLTLESFKGKTCVAGLDLAATQDLSALALIFQEENEYYVFTKYWCPRDSAELRDRIDGIPYMTWAREGFLTLTPGNVTDYAFIREEIQDLRKRFEITQLNVDPHNAIQLMIELANEGVQAEQFSQNYRQYNDPCKQFERAIMSGRLHHDANPVFRWNASCVSIDYDASGNIKPSRKNRNEKIDGIVATIMAMAACVDEHDSAYSERGPLWV